MHRAFPFTPMTRMYCADRRMILEHYLACVTFAGDLPHIRMTIKFIRSVMFTGETIL